ncbi:MAG: hypothetical protein ICV63_22240 [Coleofasciculus sp. Co-bin14]|nr:hypothetical protein [Coleofasciculus sp. Co-bin14]
MHHRRWALCSGTDVQGNNSQQVSTGVMEMKDGLNRTLNKKQGCRGRVCARGRRNPRAIASLQVPLSD